MDATHARLMTHAADTISAGAIIGSLAGLLPPLAAFVAILWYLIQIWESHTAQKWWRLRARKRRTYRAARRRSRIVKHLVKAEGPVV